MVIEHIEMHAASHMGVCWCRRLGEADAADSDDYVSWLWFAVLIPHGTSATKANSQTVTPILRIQSLPTCDMRTHIIKREPNGSNRTTI